jgi:hypothetical protein
MKTRRENPYGVFMPGQLAETAFMLKDSKRLPKTHGWGFATFQPDAATGTWKAKFDSPDFVNTRIACHTAVKDSDYVFTSYGKR